MERFSTSVGDPENPPGDAYSRQILESGDITRIQTAISLSDEEYHHPDCEQALTRADQRSFCFHHNRVTNTGILLIHGFTACPYEVRDLGQMLHGRGYNVFGLRLPGHGTTVEDFARYGAVEWRKSVEKGLGIATLFGREVTVIGLSLGGALAVELAAGFPHLVKRLILAAPCFWTQDWRVEFAPLFQRFIPVARMGVQHDWQLDYWYPSIPTSRVVELLKVIRRARKLGPMLQAKTLIIQPENDLVVQPQGTVRFSKTLTRLSPDRKKLILFKDGHHNVASKLNPNQEKVFVWVEEFLGPAV